MSLRSEAYEKIREMILRGDPLFDERTSERVIAESVDMSRTPVREALAVLTATGVVDQIPQVGVEVHRIDREEASRAVRLRIGMEAVIVEELGGRGSVDSDEVTRSLATMQDACQNGDQIEFMLADTRLHTELARLGGFHTSVTALQGLRDRIHLFRLLEPLTEAQMQDVIHEHDALIHAISGGNPSYAGQAVRDHLEATMTRIKGVEVGAAPVHAAVVHSGS